MFYAGAGLITIVLTYSLETTHGKIRQLALFLTSRLMHPGQLPGTVPSVTVPDQQHPGRLHGIVIHDGHRARYPVAREHFLQKTGKSRWKQPPGSRQRALPGVLVFNVVYETCEPVISRHWKIHP